MHTQGCPNTMGTHYTVVFNFPKAVTLAQLQHAYPDATWTQPWRRGGIVRLPVEPHPPFLAEYRDHMLAMRKQTELEEALADVEVECSPMTDMETPPKVVRTTNCPDAQPSSPFIMAGEDDLSLPISISDSYNVDTNDPILLSLLGFHHFLGSLHFLRYTGQQLQSPILMSFANKLSTLWSS
eukprot:GHVP01030846.1.p1 GENE.GHVP01030846.1~~GHVP01030846.1.p1  ORF type:complete len:182 (+),score=0.49 GHVP01030846.1:200-745(+)